jgi:hypothetical protein
VTAGRTLIRRYVLALTPAGAGNEAAVTATSVPPLSGGLRSHGSAAAHTFTIADSGRSTLKFQSATATLRPSLAPDTPAAWSANGGDAPWVGVMTAIGGATPLVTPSKSSPTSEAAL